MQMDDLPQRMYSFPVLIGFHPEIAVFPIVRQNLWRILRIKITHFQIGDDLAPSQADTSIFGWEMINKLT
jgi:hypothetical protein